MEKLTLIYSTGLGLALLNCTEPGLEKQSNYLTGLTLILWYIGVGLEKLLDYLTGLRLILLNIWLGLIELINQARMLLEKRGDF